MLDQMMPIKEANVFGFLINFFPTVTRMGMIFIFLFVPTGSSSSSLFDCISLAVSDSPLSKHQELNVRSMVLNCICRKMQPMKSHLQLQHRCKRPQKPLYYKCNCGCRPQFKTKCSAIHARVKHRCDMT